MRTYAYGGLVIGLSLLGLCVVGCTTPLAVEPKEIPAALQRVIDDGGAFAEDANPLHAVEPGAVIDSLDNLDGCWGSYAKSTTLINGQPAVEVWDVLIVDWEAQTITRWTLQRDALGLLPLLVRSEGPFEAVAEGAIEWRVERIYSSDPQTGDLQEEDLGAGDAPSLRLLVTLNGGYARLQYPGEDGTYSDDTQALYLTRFDCAD